MKARYKYPGQLVGAVKLRWPKWKPALLVPYGISFWSVQINTAYSNKREAEPFQVIGEVQLLRRFSEFQIYKLWPGARILAPHNQYIIEELPHEKVQQFGLL